jgi:hypothetical protein
MQEMNRRIEQRAIQRGSRIRRAPFLASCGVLYFGLVAPIVLTSMGTTALMTALLSSSSSSSSAMATMATMTTTTAINTKATAAAAAAASTLVTATTATTTTNPAAQQLLTIMTPIFLGLVIVQWFGFLMAAIGDVTKSLVKARHYHHHRRRRETQAQVDNSKNNDEKKNWKPTPPSYLVTGGIFSILRHPNYTGEIIGWTASCLSGLLLALVTTLLRPATTTMGVWFLPQILGYSLLALLGNLGIVFVLLQATRNLELKQQQEHAGTTMTTMTSSSSTTTTANESSSVVAFHHPDQERYQHWIASTWSGWMLPMKETKTN